MARLFLWLIPFLALGAGAALYFWPESETAREQQTLAAPAPTPVPPTIRHPVESPDEPAEPLPPLAESDPQIGDALMALFGSGLPHFVYTKNIVHRIVATVDNLPRDHLSLRLLPVKATGGIPRTMNSGETLVFSPKNALRYERYVRFAEALPTMPIMALYARFYPLFQQQYEQLGYPDKYFNDRVVEVIDHLLETPETAELPRLIQPGVLYQFADPALESRSAGQKIMLRVGSANRTRIKAKLQEIRRALVSMGPKP